MTKPQLADDAILDKVNYPCWVQPKLDGVRALKLSSILTGRSLDAFKGFGITERFSRPEYTGFDGEMVLGTDPASRDRLCSNTTGAMGRFKGVTEMADLHWWIFDYVTPITIDMPYCERWQIASVMQAKLEHNGDDRIHIVPRHVCHNRAELDRWVSTFLDAGYEGLIIRNPEAVYKPGRPGVKTQELWRVKPWMDSEMLVTGITEGSKNNNEAKKNTLGQTERSSAKDGLVPNGEVGSVQGVLLEDIYSPFTGALLFKKGLEVTVGSGEMSVKEAGEYFRHPDLIVGMIAKFKHMTHGVKDLPRMGTFVSLRLPEDMSQ